MQIQYYGYSCLKLTLKPGGRGTEGVTVLCNPFRQRAAALAAPHAGGADIVLLQQPADPLCADDALVARATAAGAIVCDTPGEYDIRGVQITGIALPPVGDAPPATLFVLRAEDLQIGLLGCAPAPLSAAHYDALAGTDVLCIACAADAAATATAVRKIQPGVVVPLQYRLRDAGRDLPPLEPVCAALGGCEEASQKVTITARDVDPEKMRTVALLPGA